MKKVVPGASKHWPHHIDLLVFCFKFRLSPVCEYLNYYYNITNDYRLIPEKTKLGDLRIYFSEKTPEIFRFVTLPLEILDKTRLYRWKFHRIVLHPFETPRPKTKTHGNSTWFFLDHLWTFHFFSFFFPTHFCIFSGIAHYNIYVYLSIHLSIYLSIYLSIKGRSQNLKQVPQNLMKVLNVDDVTLTF